MAVKGIFKSISNVKCICKACFHKIDKGVLSQIMGCLAPALLPPIHIATLYYVWQEFSRRVDRRYCSCSCWDTVFKGTYETGIASYKHIYFNATFNTLKMWVLTVSSVILCYESVRRLVLLGLQSCLRYSMLILFISAIFSHYYTWWAYWNYWNDDFYSQWNHQFFFSTTELLSTFFVLQLADYKVPVTSRKALSIVGIAVLHIIAGSLDNFVENVIRGEGYMHQTADALVAKTPHAMTRTTKVATLVVRDVGFMIPDILHFLLPLFELRRANKNSKLNLTSNLELKKDVIMITSLVSCGLVLMYITM